MATPKVLSPITGKTICHGTVDLEGVVQLLQLQEGFPNIAVPVKSDLVVFLDMDETLIKTLWRDQEEFLYDDEREILLEFQDDRGYATVYKRPHVDYFLQQLANRYSQIYAFTAGGHVYAGPILDKLDPNGTIFTQRWYRDSCVYRMNACSGREELRKNVHILGIYPPLSPKRYVFVDDNPLYTLEFPENTIPISRFHAPRCSNAPKDNALLKVLELLVQLEDDMDVRIRLNKLFVGIMRRAMQRDGILIEPIPVDEMY